MSKGNGGKVLECQVACRATCDEHHSVALRALRAESDAVSATAAIREEATELRRLHQNTREAVADTHRTVAQIVDILRRIEDDLSAVRSRIERIETAA